MKCPKCGQALPEDSVFCQFCGCTLKASSSPTPAPRNGNIPNPESTVSTLSKKATQEPKVKTAVKTLTVILLILYLLSLGLNVYQYSQYRSLKEDYSEMSRHAGIEEQLVEQKDQKIRQLQLQMQTIPEYYDFLFDFFHTRDFLSDFTCQEENPLGYASENFKVGTNSGILTMYVGEERKLSLISYVQDISIDDGYYAGLTNPVSWSCAEYSYNGSREIELSAVSPGVQVLCFTNGTSNESFDLIVIVK